jgi:hypothetical protein
MNYLNDKPKTTFSPGVVETAFRIWEQIETLSTMLWETFDDDFIHFDEMRTIEEEQRRSDAVDEMPF